MQARIHPVVMAGGSGTRLWPLSRQAYPKQLLPLASERSMLQETLRRVATAVFAPPILICNQDHRFIIAEQMREAGIAGGQIVLEPVGRNTAPAAAAGALIALNADPDALVLLMASDHVIRDVEGFRAAVELAAKAAKAGKLVTFGIKPDRPETGYGYIRAGAPLPGSVGCFAVERFVEKPDLKTAESYLAEGGYAWNSGMFLFSAKAYLAELGRLEPAMLAAVKEAVEKGARDLDFLRLEPKAFGASPSQSIDYAVMEKTALAATCPIDVGWSDVGSWTALWDIGERDSAGNVVRGDVVTFDATNSYVRSEGPLTAVIGMDEAVVVATDDCVLVAAKDRVQDVKGVVDRLKQMGRKEHAEHPTVYRPWGSYRGIGEGARFQVKRIVVKPGASLSLQMHHHRAEHWIVVSGTGRVTKGEETFLLYENQSTFIPMGMTHRLENPGHIPLELIEVQSGGYLGEDDIVRFADTYGRS
jgi:mannose-1-phosphate guanylyltransferase/mannose-6-phosphate isomerase